MKKILIGFIVIGSLAGFQRPVDKPNLKTDRKIKTDTVSYKKDVLPIFKANCLPCHTEDQLNPSELYMDTYDNLMVGGKHGKPIVVGKADSSLIIRKLDAKPPFGDRMPLKRKTSLSADTISILRAWINQGAKKN
jgi:hypothetical protein